MVSTSSTEKISFRYTCMRLLFLSSTLICGPVVSAYQYDKLYDLPLDKLVNVEVESASRFKQKSSEAPSAVEVVTAQEIRSFGWRTLADALNAMRGLYVRNDHKYSYLRPRGFLRTGDYTSRKLIMNDDERLRFEVNLESVRRACPKLKAQMLRLAREVRGKQ